MEPSGRRIRRQAIFYCRAPGIFYGSDSCSILPRSRACAKKRCKLGKDVAALAALRRATEREAAFTALRI